MATVTSLDVARLGRTRQPQRFLAYRQRCRKVERLIEQTGLEVQELAAQEPFARLRFHLLHAVRCQHGYLPLLTQRDVDA